MKTTIVITSIFAPTEAVLKFSAMEDFNLIIVGDEKSPDSYICPGVEYLKFSDQDKLGFEITALLPSNHYCRKMLGYLQAVRAGAKIIVDTDDDNIPKSNWRFPPSSGTFVSSGNALGYINIYKYFTDKNIWPRGLPLKLIKEKSPWINSLKTKNYGNVGVWQGLADEDPDVDAIWRLVYDEPTYFEEKEPIVLDSGTVAPFNSQNTWFCENLFPLLYLPTFVTFRFTDILRGLVAQPIMWAHGFNLGFCNASVVQKRNPHDYMRDFSSEIPMYRHSEHVIDCISDAVKPGQSIESNLRGAYSALNQMDIVCNKELEVLDSWLNDLSKITLRKSGRS